MEGFQRIKDSLGIRSSKIRSKLLRSQRPVVFSALCAEVHRHQQGELGLIDVRLFGRARSNAVQQGLYRVLIARVLPLGVFATMLEFFERLAALFANVGSRGFVRAYVTFKMALPNELLATLAAIKLKATLVSGYVRAESPLGLEGL